MSGLIKRLPLVALSFVASWAAHTWLMAVKNEGFNPGTKWSAWLNVDGNTGSSVIIWAAASAIVGSLVTALFRHGIGGALNGIIAAPVKLLTSLRDGGMRQRGAAMCGAGVALLLSKILPINAQASISLGLVGLYLATTPAGRSLARRSMGFLEQLGRSFSRGRSGAGSLENGTLMVAGLGPGFLLVAILSSDLRLTVALALLIGGAWLLFEMSGPTAAKGEVAGLLLFVAFSALLTAVISALMATDAWADDGGQDECRGNPGGWKDCPGSDKVIRRGLGPALGGALGAGVVPLFPPEEEKGKKDKPKGEGETKGDLPESLPPQEKRENTPEACRSLFDQYKAALGEAKGQEAAMERVKAAYETAFRNHQNNLAKLTIQLGMDAADFAQLGVSGVKAGGTISRVMMEAPGVIRQLIETAVRKVGSLTARIASVLEELAEILGRSARAARVVEDVGRLSTKAEARIGELLKEAATVESKAGDLEGLLRFSRTADSLAAERNAAAGKFLEMDQRLRAAEAEWDRRQNLQTWANGEKISIVNEDARVFSKKHEELGNIRAQIEGLKVKDPEAIEAARQAHQAKLEEASAVKRRWDEVNRLKQLHDEQSLVAEHAKAELDKFDATPHMKEYETKLQAANANKEAAVDAWGDARERAFAARDEASKLEGEMTREAAALGADPDDPAAFETLPPDRIEYYRARQKELDLAATKAKAEEDAAATALTAARKEAVAAKAALDAENVELLKERGVLESRKQVAEVRLRDLETSYLDAAGSSNIKYHEARVKSLTDEWVRLSNEADQLRLKHEILKNATFSDPAKAAELQGTQSQLETEIGNWKDVNWEEELRRQNPEMYAEWKSKVAGTDPFNEREAALKPLHEEALELRKQESELERQINAARDHLPGGATTESLEAELQSVRDDLKAKMEELTAARQEAESARSSVSEAEAAARAAEAEKQAAEKKLKEAQDEKQQAERELEDLRRKERDIFDKISDASHSARERFDDAVGSVTPGFIKSGGRWVFGKAGEAFHWAFGGQSPEEVADIIKRGDARVKELAKYLEEAQNHFAREVQHAKDLKRDLDMCEARNRR